MSRVRAVILMSVYLIVLLLLFDFLYSTFWLEAPALPGIPHPVYNHTLAPNFRGTHQWGERRYELRTNNLGFKDARVRDVELKPAGRRVVLIGDSFTEAIGLPFQETFAGMLYEAGQNRLQKVEILNAGVATYSPSLYYRKIKDLIGHGLQFDELVVLPDISDIIDEATSYFCFDDDPQYRVYCNKPSSASANSSHVKKCPFLECSFVVTDTLRVLIKFKIRQWLGNVERDIFELSPRDGWSLPNYNPGDLYAPLGVEGSITRALQNMQKLADLLAQHHIALSIAVYPWPASLAFDDRDSRQVAIWRQFCAVNKCKSFINLFPVFFAEKDAHPDWYRRYYFYGDFHFNAAGNRLIYETLAKHLL